MGMKGKLRKELHRELDGELSRSETKVFRRKMGADEAVREEYEKLRMVTEGAKALKKSRKAGGRDFSKRVMSNLPRGKKG